MATSATPMGAEPVDTLSASGSLQGKFVTLRSLMLMEPLFFMVISLSWLLLAPSKKLL